MFVLIILWSGRLEWSCSTGVHGSCAWSAPVRTECAQPATTRPDGAAWPAWISTLAVPSPSLLMATCSTLVSAAWRAFTAPRLPPLLIPGSSAGGWSGEPVRTSCSSHRVKAPTWDTWSWSWPRSWTRFVTSPKGFVIKTKTRPCATSGSLPHRSSTGFASWLSLSSRSSAPLGSSCLHPIL